MAIHRIHRRPPGFVQIDNKTIRDRALSFRARGVLGYLLSLKDGEECAAADLADESPLEGVKAIRSAYDELAAVGYLRRVRVQSINGRWATEIHVFELPQAVDNSPGTVPTDLPSGPPGATRRKGAKPQVAPTTPDRLLGDGVVKNLEHEGLEDVEDLGASAEGETRDEARARIAAVLPGVFGSGTAGRRV